MARLTGAIAWIVLAVCAGAACTQLDESHGAGDAGDRPGGSGGDAGSTPHAGSGGSAGGMRDGGSTPERDAGRRGDASAALDGGSTDLPADAASDSGSAVDGGPLEDSGSVEDSGSDSGSVPEPRCGDSHVDPGEDCDDGSATATCTEDCTTPIVIPPGCGDGHVDPGEDCDDGAESATCNADCTTSVCGDHKRNVTANETCDGGGETATCNDDCTARSCGDHKTNATAGEQCDDGGESATCNSDCTTRSCGDSKTNLTAGEQCDDGKNGNAGDGCTDACAYSCTVDDDCGATYGGRCSAHACVPRTFGMPASLQTTSSLSWFRLAMDGRGNALVVWEDNHVLRHAWYSAANGWGAQSMLVDNGKYPQLGSDGKGNFLLAYSATDTVTAKLEHVRMRRYRPGASAPVPDPSGWKAEDTVKSYSNYSATGTDWITPAVGIGSSGDAWLAWNAQQQTGGGMGSSAIWVARCDNGGDDCATASSISSATRLANNPQIILDNAGFYPLVIWSLAIFNSNEDSVIRGARYDDAWSVTDIATATAPDRVTNNKLVGDANGQGWLAIQRLVGGTISGSILRNRQASLGSAFSWAAPLATPRSLATALAANGIGDLLATPIELKNSSTVLAITGAAMDAGSGTWSSEAPLDSIPFDPSSAIPSVALDGYGHGVALWVTNDGAKSAVAATRVLRSSGVVWSTPGDVSERTTDTLSDVQVALEADGRGVAGWLQDDGNNVTLWVSAFK